MLERDRIINVSDLRIGTRFSEPLFFDDRKHMFLARNYPLTQNLLDSLLFWKVPYVVTCGLEYLSSVDEGTEEDDIPELEAVS